MKRKHFTALGLSAALSLSAAVTPISADELTPAEEMIDQIVEGDNALGVRILTELLKKEDTVFISSYSIASALSLLGHGSSEGEQIDAIWSLLGTEGLDQEQIAEANALLAEKIIPGYGWADEYSDAAKQSMGLGKVELANLVLLDDRFCASDRFGEYEDLISYYDAQIEQTDLSDTSIVDKVNSWVSDKTHDLIQELIQDPFDEDARMLLMNSLYFKGEYANPFEQELTDDQTFYGTDGETTISMMHEQAYYQYGETDDCQIIIIPYAYNHALKIYLPKDRDVRGEDLNVEALLQTEVSLEYCEVALSLPKFELTYETELSELLCAMGLEPVFVAHNYDRLSQEALFASEILHKTAIKNDENGTEAAAVTAVMIKALSAMPPQDPVVMTVDHPFLFTITDIETGLDLFIGVVGNL